MELIGVLEDEEVGAVLAADELTSVDPGVDEPAAELVDDPDDDRSVVELAVEPVGLCELVAVKPVAVASEPDSGAASGARVSGAVASAVASRPITMAMAAITVTTTRAAARSGPDRAMRARPTAIKPSTMPPAGPRSVSGSGIVEPH